MPKNKAEININDVNFIIEEIVRLNTMEWEKLIEHHKKNKKDFWFNVPHFNGDGQLTLGEAAGHRLWNFAIRYLSTSSELSSNFDTAHFVKELKRVFVWTFLKNHSEVNQRNIDKMLTAAVKRAKADHKILTHYIPCVLFRGKEPETFRIGPVLFVWMEKFIQENKEHFEAERQRMREEYSAPYREQTADGSSVNQLMIPEESTGVADFLVDNSVEYFEKFKWMAMVTVPECDPKISRKRAERVIEATLDIFKLLLGRTWGKRLRLGSSVGSPISTGHLTSEPNGKLHFSVKLGFQEETLDEEWFEVLTLHKKTGILPAVESALNACIDPTKHLHLKERFLDALAWFGQAVSETQPSVQIIKYVAALERLTVTGKPKEGEAGVWSIVTKRTALLNYNKTIEDYQSTLKDARILYDLRSELMHGSKSPFDKEIEAIIPLAERLTKNAIIGGLKLFTESAEKDAKIKEKKLEKIYREMEDEMELRITS